MRKLPWQSCNRVCLGLVLLSWSSPEHSSKLLLLLLLAVCGHGDLLHGKLPLILVEAPLLLKAPLSTDSLP
jgi:hypothetical protein